MKKTKMVVAVQLVVHHDENLTLSSQERRQVEKEFSDEMQVRWLPQIGGGRKLDKVSRHRLTLESEIAIFLLGVAFSSVVKPFLKSASKEAGKDFWKFIKDLAGRIWNTQAKRSYHLNSRIWTVFDLGEDSLFVEVRVSDFELRETGQTFDKFFERELTSLAANW